MDFEQHWRSGLAIGQVVDPSYAMRTLCPALPHAFVRLCPVRSAGISTGYDLPPGKPIPLPLLRQGELLWLVRQVLVLDA